MAPAKTRAPRATGQTQAAKDREAEILEEALAAFEGATGLRLDLDREAPAPGGGADAVARIHTADGEQILLLEIKPHLTTQNLGAALAQVEGLPGKAMLITQYMAPPMAERLRERGVAFADTAGNAYLNLPPTLIYLAGRRLPGKTARPAPTRAFQPTGLKVVFALLCDPALAGAPYRDIAAATGAALGTVGWVVGDLKALGFIAHRGRHGRRLVDREKLLNRWAAAYPEQLRPRLHLGRFAGPRPDWWKEAPLVPKEACWGGEVAAARRTRYLKPERVTIYARGRAADLALRHKLRKDPEGNTEILQAFWPEKQGNRGELAPPLVIYADLLMGGDPRNLETAKLIYERDLAGLVGED